MKEKILHYCDVPNQVLNSFADLIDNSQRLNESYSHHFMISKNVENEIFNPSQRSKFNNITFECIDETTSNKGLFSKIIYKLKLAKTVYKKVFQYEKIFFHSLPPVWLQLVIVLGSAHTNFHWIIFGGDLYEYQKRNNSFKSKIKEGIRKAFIKKIPYVYTRLEYENLKEWYSTNAKNVAALYPLLLDFKLLDEVKTLKSTDNIANKQILIGNSACPTNNHIEIFNAISKYIDSSVKVVVPLSYSITDRKYLNDVLETGNKIFGDSFEPLLDYMKPKDYMKLLTTVDVAVMNHDRQRGLGVILPLLYLEKKVYVKSTTTISTYLKNRLGCIVYNTENIFLNENENLFINKNLERNPIIIKEELSYEKLIQEWSKAFSL